MPESCGICGSVSQLLFTHSVLNKHEISYFICHQCGHVFTEDPYWLGEAYSSAIAESDIGLIGRNLRLSRIVSRILYYLYQGDGRYLDLAGGYGILTRILRDIGFDCYWYDEYSENLFARGFKHDSSKVPYTAVTCFEVLEHVPNPKEFIQGIFDKYKPQSLIFSTELYDGTAPTFDWWYFTFDTGQHISFYHKRTLQYIASELGLHFITMGSISIFSKTNVRSRAIEFLSTGKLGFLFDRMIRWKLKSLLPADYEKTLARIESRNTHTME